MNTEFERLVHQVMALPHEDRSRLVQWVIESFDGPEIEEDDADQVWRKEIQRRLTEIQEGTAETVPGDEVMAELRSLLRR